jgi:peptide/nickel transport system permease protein
MTAIPQRPGRRSLRTLGVSAELLLSSAILLIAAGTAIVGPLLMAKPGSQNLADAFASPGSAGHPMGTDQVGRDVLSWIASSLRTSFVVSLSVVAIAAVVGVTIGLLAGYVGGVLDAITMRLVDLHLSIPPLLLFVAAAATLGHSVPVIIALLAIPSWVPYARVIRPRVQVGRDRASIKAARLAGVGHIEILVRHLLPGTRSLVVVLASLQVGWILLWESALSFAGVGVQSPTSSIGFMIAEGRTTLSTAWWIVAFPGMVLALLILASNLMGDALGRLFDEKAGIEL